MNLIKHTGLVLRTYFPRKQKLSIFDSQLGKIACIVHKQSTKILQRIGNGSLVQYYVKPLQTVHELCELELIAVPTELARHDIYFLHHILELCYFFLPEHLESRELFELVARLYDYKASVWNNNAQRIFLLKFFATLGLFPEETPSFHPDIYRLISLSIEGMLKKNLDAPLEKEIDTLILACIGAHPYKNQFKTVHFISRTENHDGKKP